MKRHLQELTEKYGDSIRPKKRTHQSEQELLELVQSLLDQHSGPDLPHYIITKYLPTKFLAPLYLQISKNNPPANSRDEEILLSILAKLSQSTNETLIADISLDFLPSLIQSIGANASSAKLLKEKCKLIYHCLPFLIQSPNQDGLLLRILAMLVQIVSQYQKSTSQDDLCCYICQCLLASGFLASKHPMQKLLVVGELGVTFMRKSPNSYLALYGAQIVSSLVVLPTSTPVIQISSIQLVHQLAHQASLTTSNCLRLEYTILVRKLFTKSFHRKDLDKNAVLQMRELFLHLVEKTPFDLNNNNWSKLGSRGFFVAVLLETTNQDIENKCYIWQQIELMVDYLLGLAIEDKAEILQKCVALLIDVVSLKVSYFLPILGRLIKLYFTLVHDATVIPQEQMEYIMSDLRRASNRNVIGDDFFAFIILQPDQDSTTIGLLMEDILDFLRQQDKEDIIDLFAKQNQNILDKKTKFKNTIKRNSNTDLIEVQKSKEMNFTVLNSESVDKMKEGLLKQCELWNNKIRRNSNIRGRICVLQNIEKQKQKWTEQLCSLTGGFYYTILFDVLYYFFVLKSLVNQEFDKHDNAVEISACCANLQNSVFKLYARVPTKCKFAYALLKLYFMGKCGLSLYSTTSNESSPNLKPDFDFLDARMEQQPDDLDWNNSFWTPLSANPEKLRTCFLKLLRMTSYWPTNILRHSESLERLTLKKTSQCLEICPFPYDDTDNLLLQVQELSSDCISIALTPGMIKSELGVGYLNFNRLLQPIRPSSQLQLFRQFFFLSKEFDGQPARTYDELLAKTIVN